MVFMPGSGQSRNGRATARGHDQIRENFQFLYFFDPVAPQVGFSAYQKYNQEFKINAKTPDFGRDLVARSSLGMGLKQIKIVTIFVTKNRCRGAT